MQASLVVEWDALVLKGNIREEKRKGKLPSLASVKL